MSVKTYQTKTLNNSKLIPDPINLQNKFTGSFSSTIKSILAPSHDKFHEVHLKNGNNKVLPKIVSSFYKPVKKRSRGLSMPLTLPSRDRKAFPSHLPSISPKHSNPTTESFSPKLASSPFDLSCLITKPYKLKP